MVAGIAVLTMLMLYHVYGITNAATHPHSPHYRVVGVGTVQLREVLVNILGTAKGT